MMNEGVELAADVLRRQLARSGAATLRVRGHSMRPLLRDGARVELRPVRPGEDLTGHVVAIDTGPRVIVHRVDRVRDTGPGAGPGSWIETRGLAVAAADPPWRAADVIGVVRGRWLRPLAAAVAAAYRVRRRVTPTHPSPRRGEGQGGGTRSVP
jgi:hypothetical protein